MIWAVMSPIRACKAEVLVIELSALLRDLSISPAIEVAARWASWDAELASSAPAAICSIAFFSSSTAAAASVTPDPN